MSVPTISQQEKDPFKVAASLRQAVEQVNTLTSDLGAIVGLTDGDKGDITVASSGAAWTIDNNAVTTAKILDDNVTNAKLANIAQGLIKGRAAGAGTGDPTDLTGTQATAILDVFTSLLKGLVPASGGVSTTYLNGAGAFTTPPAGAVLQVLQNAYTTNANITAQIPLDDTAPLTGEGTTILTQVITPTSASNKVLVEVCLNGSLSTAPNSWIASVFRGSTCIQAQHVTLDNTLRGITLSLDILDTPATTSATTYTVNVGPVAANTLRMNGTSGARLFGGVAACTLTLMEVT